MTHYLDHTAVAKKLLDQQGEIKDLRAALDRVHQACAATPPCTPGSQAEDIAHAKGWNAAMDHVLNRLAQQ